MGAGFSYYLPGITNRTHVTPELCVARGLEGALWDVLDDWHPPHNAALVDVRRGPDAGVGQWLYPLPKSGASVGDWNVEALTWIDRGGYWLGWDPKQPPTPADLARPEIVPGYDYKLGDGNVWQCPIVRKRYVLHNLPSVFKQDKAGNWSYDIVARHAALWARSADWFRAFLGKAQLTDAELISACVDLLSLNYRVSGAEVTALELLKTSTLPLVFQAGVDGPWWTDYAENPQKKTEVENLLQDVMNSSPGDAGDSTATNQAEPN